jgi:hypothetical protein
VKFPPLLESAPGEFLGRSPEEAVERARSVLGTDAKVRCWKTRRGGVLGFFAREVYVAGVKEPKGKSSAPTPREESPSQAQATLDEVELPTLDDLIASTTDEVSYGADAAVEDRAFRDVLAQAEAALSDAVFDDDAWRPEETPNVSAPASDASLASDHGLVAFRSALESFGLPAAYRPADRDNVLDGLVRSLSSLPTPPVLPTAPGSVIAVIGSRRDALTVANEVAAFLGLEEGDVIAWCDDAVVRRRIARRKRSTRVTIVALEASARGRSFDAAREELERLAPDCVLGVAAATLKCADVELWRRELGIEALALRRWEDTETPAELLAALPIFSVDGVVMSTMRWVSLLLSTFVDRTDATA